MPSFWLLSVPSGRDVQIAGFVGLRGGIEAIVQIKRLRELATQHAAVVKGVFLLLIAFGIEDVLDAIVQRIADAHQSAGRVIAER